MSDQLYPGDPSPRSSRRSYKSYEERYTYSTREGQGRQSGSYEGRNNPRDARSSANNPRNADGSGRIRVESHAANNPRTRGERRSSDAYAPASPARASRASGSRGTAPSNRASSGSRTPRTNSARPSAGSVNPVGGVGGVGDRSRYTAQRTRKPFAPVLAIILIIVLVGAGFGAYNIVNPAQFEVSINGMTKTLKRGTTINDVIAEGIVSPVAGDLIAVDNSIITEGAGDRFSAVLNDVETNDGEIVLRKEDVIQVSDGKDIMEEYSVEEVITEPGRSVEGVGSIHHYVKGIQGKTEVRTGATSGLTVETVITPVSDAMFKSYNADVGADKVIALTFDDGPWPTTTDQILDILKEYNVKATFFAIGQQLGEYPEAAKRIVDEGHQLCSHTWDHADGSGQGVNLTYMTAEEQIAEITKSYEAIEEITGTEASRVIRAPGGNYYDEIIWTLEPYVDAEIGWNVDTQDWSRPGADSIAWSILSAQPGDVVLMHDGGGDRSQTVQALRTALPQLIERGYTFVTIDELIAYNDPASMEPGTWN